MTDTSDKAIEALVKYHDWKDSATEDEPSETSAMLLALQAERKAGWEASVRPLEFNDENGDGVLTSRETGRLMRVFPQSNGKFFAPGISQTAFVTAQEAIDAYQADHLQRTLAALTPNTEAKP